MGDAKTLQGGVLLQTPLMGADGKIYAVAQGALILGGVSAGTEGGGGATVQKNHPTVGQIADGALVEQEIPAHDHQRSSSRIGLARRGFHHGGPAGQAVNDKFSDSSLALDSTTVRVRVPEDFETTPVNFISMLEAVEVETDIPARIVINERTGTIVATSHIHISSCAVSHGNVTISIASTLNVSQAAPFSQNGQAVVTPQTDTKVKEDRGAMVAAARTANG